MVEMTFFNRRTPYSLLLASRTVSRCLTPVFIVDLIALFCWYCFLFCLALFSVDLCLIGMLSPNDRLMLQYTASPMNVKHFLAAKQNT